MRITSKIIIDLQQRKTIPQIEVMQNDACTRVVAAALYCGSTPWEVPVEVTAVSLAYRKSDGTSGWYDTLPDGTPACSVNGNTVEVQLAPEALTCAGKVAASIVLQDSNLNRLATFPFIIMAEADPAADKRLSNNYYRMRSLADADQAMLELQQTLSEAAMLDITNLLTTAALTKGYYYSTAQGGLKAGTAYDLYTVYLAPGSYTIYPRVRFVTNITEGTENDVTKTSATVAPHTFTVTIPSLCHISVYSSDVDPKLFTEGTELSGVDFLGVKRLAPDIKIPSAYTVNNLLTDAEFTPGHYYNKDQGTPIVSAAGYNLYKVYLYPGDYTAYPKARFITDLTANTQIGSSSVKPTAEESKFTVTQPSIYYISMYATDAHPKLFTTGANPDEIDDVGIRRLPADVKVENPYDGNVLRGKTWVAFGDSFTQAGYSSADGIDESEYKFQDGPYAGKQITYPYIIGLRNNMEILNKAAGGMSLTKNDNAQASGKPYYFADPAALRYEDIPAGTDYITLWFGINDSKTSAAYPIGSTVGTIDDETPETFYGAWNIVLRSLITNHPFAKIGIVITNGSAPEYTEATRAICHKWGIPYLDMEKDPGVPLMLRVNEREGLCQEVKDLRNAAFRVSASNKHPNTAAQYYQSTFIENWLRSL